MARGAVSREQANSRARNVSPIKQAVEHAFAQACGSN